MYMYYADLRAKLFSNISEIYDINNMSDNDKFLLLMGFQDLWYYYFSYKVC